MSYDNYNWDYRRTKIVGPAQLKAANDIFHPTVDQRYALGTEYWMNDGTGRAFRYCENGAVALAKALMASGAAQDAQAITSTEQTAYGASAKAKKFDVLLSTGNAWSDHDLVDGWLVVSDGTTALGDMYLIKDNYWTTSDTVMNVEIADAGGLRNAILAASDDVILIKNKCKDTVVNATNPVSSVVGVPLVIVPISYYYWAQFRGWAPVICDGTDTVVVGDFVMQSESVAGAVALLDCTTTVGDDHPYGICVLVGAVSETCVIDLLIP